MTSSNFTFHRASAADAFKYVTTLCLACVLCIAVLRVWIRRTLYGPDDAIIAVSILVSIGHFAANYVALAYGLGSARSVTQEGKANYALDGALFASTVTFAISLFLSKSAVTASLSRLTRDRIQNLVYRICQCLLAVVGTACVLMVTAGWSSSPGFYWTLNLRPDTCQSQAGRWAAFTVLDILTEILMLVLPVYQVRNLQMPWKNKAIVIGAYSIRLPVIALAIGRQVYISALCDKRSNNTSNITEAMVWLQVELTWAIISNTFTSLREFTLSFNSNFGLGFARNEVDGGSRSESSTGLRPKADEYAMTSISSRDKTNDRP